MSLGLNIDKTGTQEKPESSVVATISSQISQERLARSTNDLWNGKGFAPGMSDPLNGLCSGENETNTR